MYIYIQPIMGCISIVRTTVPLLIHYVVMV